MTHNILLIEDDSSVLVGLTNALQSEGYSVIAAANGSEGICSLRSIQRVDLVLLDLGLPGASGWEVMKCAAASRPLVPVIIITAKPDQYWPARNAHAAALMEKPLDIPTLLNVMAKLLSETPEQRTDRCNGETNYLRYTPSNTAKGAWS